MQQMFDTMVLHCRGGLLFSFYLVCYDLRVMTLSCCYDVFSRLFLVLQMTGQWTYALVLLRHFLDIPSGAQLSKDLLSIYHLPPTAHPTHPFYTFHPPYPTLNPPLPLVLSTSTLIISPNTSEGIPIPD